MTDGINRLQLTGRLVECDPLRHTPAGIAICQATLEHQSSQPDAGHPRDVRFTIAARFTGDLARRISEQPLGRLMQLSGFIAAKRMFRDGGSSAGLVFHVATYDVQPESDESD